MQQRLPEALGDYAQRQVARFHMPGHKGRGMGGFFRPELARWDITELSFSDDLQNPQAAIASAQQACAAQYGAAHTFFLVNGSTAGVLALLLALPKGAHVLIGRDCHRSVLSGIALAGHMCSFLSPAYAAAYSLFGCVTPAALEEAFLSAHYDAVFVTSPNYYGLCANIPALAQIAHRHGALLFVDAAHGAHFPFSPALPASPAGYADGWVNSAHKTLNALGQAALLHVGEKLPVHVVQKALSFVQTSSPSYLLLASLDWARYSASVDDGWTRTAAAVCALAKEIDESLLGLHVLYRYMARQAGVWEIDPTRLVIDVSERGITGYAAQAALEQRNVFVEMADMQRLVCICTPADHPAWYPRLVDALRAMPYGERGHIKSAAWKSPVLTRIMPVHEAMRAPFKQCPLHKAAGKVAAAAAGVYPPGIPLWTPGECINTACVARLQAEQQCGASLFGVQDNLVSILA